MKLSLEQLSARMRQGETIPSRQTAQVALALSIPSILEQLVVTAMGYIDAAMVGHIGAEATASIGIVSSSTWLLHGVLVGLYTALSIQIAQYLGADRQDDARSVLRQAMLFNVILGVGAALFGLGISPFLPGWLGADPSLRANATAYFAIWSTALPFTMAMGMYTSILRAAGYALTASLISVLVCVLDAIFNFFLINPTRTLRGITVWGAGLGVPGAALGTALATVVGGLLALCILLFREGPLCIHKPGSWKITRACIRNLGKVGVPLAAERAALSSAQVLQVRIVSQLGTVAIAANSLGVSAEGLCYMAGYGIQGAAIALIGQAVGAHRKDMAKRFAWLCTLMGMGIMTLTGAGLFAFAPALMSIFTADAAVIALGARVLRIEAFAEPMFGASIVASGAMQGAGDSTACFVLNLVSMWGIRLTLAFLLAPRLGLMGVWGAMCCELSIRGLLFLIRLARGKWLEKGALS
ncbi:MATE family efflux transporter [Faecalibacterium duncaniae]|uniref:MATE family efflux transporter n=1 Tax=Faecalibacterium duncaniae (strain DSM 17677 / JCM 31915 / A2-165) TaxID=411483 RepID=UPI0029403ED7|nr:MATE family efflux transporter [Faecalibacterium duncaniae]MDV5041596.1 MATE family efflux transporter [Faecalibacterium duncaniae]